MNKLIIMLGATLATGETRVMPEQLVPTKGTYLALSQAYGLQSQLSDTIRILRAPFKLVDRGTCVEWVEDSRWRFGNYIAIIRSAGTANLSLWSGSSCYYAKGSLIRLHEKAE